MILIDHTDKTWAAQQKRPNGAEKYSKDIVRVDVPLWEKLCGESNLVVSTCPRLHKVRYDDYDISGSLEQYTCVQYLHTFPKADPVANVREIEDGNPFISIHNIYLSAYTSYVSLLRAHGYTAYHMPMYINPQEVIAAQRKPHELPLSPNDVLWFGNVYSSKRGMYNTVKATLRMRGMRLHTISEGVYTNAAGEQKTVTQEEAWWLASHFRYGVGVGRCALEMMALGLRVLIAGDSIGGIVTNEAEYQAQQAVNFNTRVCTFDNDINNCISAMVHLPDDEYKIISPYPDVEQRHKIINRIVEDYPVLKLAIS